MARRRGIRVMLLETADESFGVSHALAEVDAVAHVEREATSAHAAQQRSHHVISRTGALALLGSITVTTCTTTTATAARRCGLPQRSRPLHHCKRVKVYVRSPWGARHCGEFARWRGLIRRVAGFAATLRPGIDARPRVVQQYM